MNYLFTIPYTASAPTPMKAPVKAAMDGPANKAGLLPGDVILDFDGKKVDEMRQLPRIVADTDIGKRVKVGVWRKGSRENFVVVVGELVEATTKKVEKNIENKSRKFLGMNLSSIGPKERATFKKHMGKEQKSNKKLKNQH